MDATILVTGGAGFIGSCFVRMLIEQTEATVINLDKLTYAGNLSSLPEADGNRHCFHRGDICDGDLVGKLLAEHRPDAVVHFAAESHVDRSIDGPRDIGESSVSGNGEPNRWPWG